MFRSWLRCQTVLPLIFAVAVFAGCSDDDTTTAPDPSGSEELNLEDEFGGYSATDELPSFDDDVVADVANENREVDDNVASDPETSRVEGEDGTRVFAMTLRWGHFGGTPELGGADKLDWSGSIRTTGESRIVLLNVVSFEPGDGAVLPRQDPQLLEWTSSIANGHDGIRIVVLQPNEVGAGGDSLYLDTTLFDGAFALDDLVDYDNMLDVGEAGLDMRFQSIETEDVGDVNTFQGWVDGRWRWSEDQERGTFHGVWVNPRAGAIGHVRGHFGTNKAGENVFFGKYIDRAGQFQGFLRGSFTLAEGDLATGRGRFQGNWFSADRDTRGHALHRLSVRARLHTGLAMIAR